MEENQKIIEELAGLYEKMNLCIENILENGQNPDYDKEKLVDDYKEINELRKEALKYISKYRATADPVETNNMKTLRKGILNIINTAKASMLLENSYENQRGINKMSLETLIPVISFKFHHANKFPDEIFMLTSFEEFENIYEQQVNTANIQLNKSQEIKESLNSDLENINVLLNDYKITSNIYEILGRKGLISEDYKQIFIEIETDNNTLIVQMEDYDGAKKQFTAGFEDLNNLSDKNLKFKEGILEKLEVDQDSIIHLKELKEIAFNISDNLKELDESVGFLNDKIKQLDKDKKALETVRDDFMKNGTQSGSKEGGELRLSAE